MCGIAGIVQFNRSEIDSQIFRKISDSLSSRGPDDLGFLGFSGTSTIEISRNPDDLQNSWLGLGSPSAVDLGSQRSWLAANAHTRWTLCNCI
jgi:asparagine synthetase B (glutamine-hydrolysing)